MSASSDLVDLVSTNSNSHLFRSSTSSSQESNNNDDNTNKRILKRNSGILEDKSSQDEEILSKNRKKKVKIENNDILMENIDYYSFAPNDPAVLQHVRQLKKMFCTKEVYSKKTKTLKRCN